MPKSRTEVNYKEALKIEVNRIPEHDTTFMVQLITIIRKHMEKTGKH